MTSRWIFYHVISMTSNLHYALRTASDQMFHCPHKSLAALFSHSYTRLSVIKWSSTLHTQTTRCNWVTNYCYNYTTDISSDNQILLEKPSIIHDRDILVSVESHKTYLWFLFHFDWCRHKDNSDGTRVMIAFDVRLYVIIIKIIIIMTIIMIIIICTARCAHHWTVRRDGMK